MMPLECKYCGTPWKNIQALRAHLRFCPMRSRKALGGGGVAEEEVQPARSEPAPAVEPMQVPWSPVMFNLEITLFDCLNAGMMDCQTAAWIKNTCRQQPARLAGPYALYYSLVPAGVDPALAWQLSLKVFGFA